jgi:hypothetical protein
MRGNFHKPQGFSINERDFPGSRGKLQEAEGKVNEREEKVNEP